MIGRKRQAAQDRAEREAAERELARTRARWRDVHAAVEVLRRLRERNHFAENINAAFRGGSTP